MTTLTPYLLFDGTCQKAMEFYQSCLGGELTLTRVKDSPAKQSMPPAQHDKTLNAHLKKPNLAISASDWLASGAIPIRGNTVCLYLHTETPDELNTFFAKLAEGGEVTNPLTRQFFGLYGALNDKFGVRWMLHCSSQEQE